MCMVVVEKHTPHGCILCCTHTKNSANSTIIAYHALNTYQCVQCNRSISITELRRMRVYKETSSRPHQF